MQINTKKLLIVFGVLLVFIYIKFYNSVPSNVKLLQMSIGELTPSILMRKYPIILDERIVNPINILQTVFKYLYVYKQVKAIDDGVSGVFRQNKSRYMLLYSKCDYNSIDIANPHMKRKAVQGEEPPFVEIKLHSNMCMILPYRYWYRCWRPDQLMTVALEDILSLTMKNLIK